MTVDSRASDPRRRRRGWLELKSGVTHIQTSIPADHKPCPAEPGYVPLSFEASFPSKENQCRVKGQNNPKETPVLPKEKTSNPVRRTPSTSSTNVCLPPQRVMF